MDTDNKDDAPKKKLRKNPNVDTSFLPDRDREETERKERERLRVEWLERQEELKKEEIETTSPCAIPMHTNLSSPLGFSPCITFDFWAS